LQKEKSRVVFYVRWGFVSRGGAALKVARMGRKGLVQKLKTKAWWDGEEGGRERALWLLSFLGCLSMA
jgi:hypothetical protein